MMRFENVVFPYRDTLCFGDIEWEKDKISRISKKYSLSSFNGFVIPGFIDTHTHGFRGYSSEADDLDLYLNAYLDRGVTTVCPTVGPRLLKEFGRLVERYSSCKDGAHCAGLHLEGPYLSPVRCGAIDPSRLLEIKTEELGQFLASYGHGIAIMTIAPEVSYAVEAIRLLKKYGVRPSYGHTDANYEEASACYERNLCGVTHLYNAMRPLNHHEAGIIDFIYNQKIPVEMICDGNHVNEKQMAWTIDLLGKHMVHCISDGGESCGCSYPEGYELAPGIKVMNGAVYEGNTLAGSTRDLYDAFLKFALEFHYSLVDAVRLTSQNAAEYLGLPCGKIETGYQADLLLLDGSYQMKEVYLSGVQVR